MSRVPYANVVGSLMYAIVCMRPDISHAIGVVSRYMHDLGKGHWQTMKWIIRYLLKIVHVGIVMSVQKHSLHTWDLAYLCLVLHLNNHYFVISNI